MLTSGKVCGSEIGYVDELDGPTSAPPAVSSAAVRITPDEALRQFQELGLATIRSSQLPKFESLLGQLIEIHGSNPIGEDQNTLLHWICIILTPQAGGHGPYLQYVDYHTQNEIITITRKAFPSLKELLSLRNKRRETPLDCIRVASIMGDNTPGENLATKVYGLLTVEPSA